MKTIHRHALDLASELVATIRPADLGRPTPCAGWDLAALLAHMTGQNHGFADALRGGTAVAAYAPVRGGGGVAGIGGRPARRRGAPAHRRGAAAGDLDGAPLPGAGGARLPDARHGGARVGHRDRARPRVAARPAAGRGGVGTGAADPGGPGPHRPRRRLRAGAGRGGRGPVDGSARAGRSGLRRRPPRRAPATRTAPRPDRSLRRKGAAAVAVGSKRGGGGRVGGRRPSGRDAAAAAGWPRDAAAVAAWPCAARAILAR